jgi:hypothetical protein
MLLLSGDISKPIPVHPPQQPSLLLVWLLVAMLLIFSLVKLGKCLLPASH